MMFGVRWLIQHFPKYVGLTLQGLGVVALLVLVVRLYLGRDWLRRLGQEFVIGSDLIEATENLLNDLPKPKNETTANFIGHLVYRFTRLGLIGLILALIPITLLYQQNKLLLKQNERLDQQTYLQEAERRSSLVFLFSNIMDAIDKELKEDYGNDSIRNLSPELTGRIVGLSTRLKPYYYLDGDTLITKPLSPERGQLLISLIVSELDSLGGREVYGRSDFSYADLKDSNLSHSNLYYVDLTSADLRSAFLSDANLRNANLRDANLNWAYLGHADLVDADLRNATLRNATLRHADLTNADLRNADFSNVDLTNANLNNAIVEGDFLLKIHKSEISYNHEYTSNNYQIDSTLEYKEWRYRLKPKSK